MKSIFLSASLLSLFATIAIGCSDAETDPPVNPAPTDWLYGVDEQPFGKTYEQWAQTWWEWALTIPKAENPILDGPCEGYQMGDVFFLAGNAGGTSERSCTVPAGKAIFFPIVNVITRNCPELVDGTNYTCEMATSEMELQKFAVSTLNDSEVTMNLEINGEAVANLADWRAQTGTFNDPTPDMAADVLGSPCSGPIRDNTCGVPVGSERMSAGDGYWVMLKPLPAGSHEVHFDAKVAFAPDMAFELAVTYNLTVAP